MKNTSAVIVLALLLTGGPASGQDKKNTSRADRFYENLGYHSAIQAYGEAEFAAEAMENLAHSYRLNGDTRNAERCYAEVVKNTGDPLNFFYYAQALQSNGKYGLAREYFLRYDQCIGAGTDRRGERMAEAVERPGHFVKEKTVVVHRENLANSPKLDFSPAFFKDGIVFVSNREPSGALPKPGGKDPWTGDDFSRLYFSKIMENGGLSEPEIFEAELLNRFHEGPPTFSRDGKRLFFTGNEQQAGRGEARLKIFQTEKLAGAWCEPSPLDLAGELANDAHPSLSPDGFQLIFSSDRPGGYGGMDLYLVRFGSGGWGQPVNLGPSVNTAGHEVFPFIFEDGTLYYASDGWGGLGGLDIFLTKAAGSEGWSGASNLGVPFNSLKDDFGFILDRSGRSGYFTSARDGGAGKDDLYRFQLTEPQGGKENKPLRPAVICVTDTSSGQPLQGVKISVLEQLPDGGFQGYDGDFLVKMTPAGMPGEYEVMLKKRDPFDLPSDETETWTTGPDGRLQVAFHPEKDYLIVLKSEGFGEIRRFVSSEEIAAGLTFFENCLRLVPSGCLQLSGRVLDKRSASPVAAASVTLVNLCNGELTSVESDDMGRYEFPCVPCGCDFIVQASHGNFKQENKLASTAGLDCRAGNATAGPDLLLTAAPGEEAARIRAAFQPENPERPISEFVGETDVFNKILANGLTVELDQIYYDFGKSGIRPDAAGELEKIVALLQRQPDLKVELRAHTDARGDSGFNLQLSSSRAKAAADYMVKRGIGTFRIAWKGFGESWLTNECEDGVPCSEVRHQMNRRTEIRLFK